MRTLLSFIVPILLISSIAVAQEQKSTETSFKVFGNCNMCKNRIEKAVKVDGVDKASWDKQTRLLTVSYHPAEITVDSLQKRIAAVGHDTSNEIAPDEVYEALPECCLYRDADNVH